MKLWIAWASALFPMIAIACDGNDIRKCEAQFRDLVAYRNEAIETAFGDLSGALPAQLQIKFVKTRDPEYALLAAGTVYDAERHVLMFPHTASREKMPNPLRSAYYYWPFHQQKELSQEFPVVEAVDNALWSAYLQEAARARGLTWPHKGCASGDVGERLPCEMLTTAIARYVDARRDLLFNENRVDRIWPEDFADFRKRVWNRRDPQYRDIQRYGGILLIKPLIGEFGVPQVFAYVAQTPFDIEENNVRISALRYQDRARAVLRTRVPDPVTLGSRPRDCASPEQPGCAMRVSF